MRGEKEGLVRWFSEITPADEQSVGVEGVNISRLYQKKLLVPPGFILSKEFCENLVKSSGVESQIKALLLHIDKNNKKKMNETASRINEIISDLKINKVESEEIKEAYGFLDTSDLFSSAKKHSVSVKSSLSELNYEASNSEELEKSIIKCYAKSIGSEQWINKNNENNIYEEVPVIIVQKAVGSEVKAQVYSRNPENADEMVVEALATGFMPDKYILERNLEKLSIKESKVAENEKPLDNYVLKRMALYADEIESLLKCPQKIEFSFGKDGLHVLYSEPIHVDNNKHTVKEEKAKEAAYALQSLEYQVDSVAAQEAVQEIKEWESYDRPETLEKLFKTLQKKDNKEAPEAIEAMDESLKTEENIDYQEAVLKALE